MEITVLLFASVADRLGVRRLSLEVANGATVANARDMLQELYPQIAPFLPNLLYALNEEYVRTTEPLAPGATLALIPPVSGG